VARTASAPSATRAAFVSSSLILSLLAGSDRHPWPSFIPADYAKLVRKRDRLISTLPAGGPVPAPIDIAFLRKSARLAAENSALARSTGRRRPADDNKPSKAEGSTSNKRTSSHIDSDSEGSSVGGSRDIGSGRRGWGRLENGNEQPMHSPNSFPRASPYPPPAPHMSPNHPMAGPIHHSASPVHASSPPMMLRPMATAAHTTLPSMRPSYPSPMSYPPTPHPGSYHPAYNQPSSYGPPMQQPGYGPPPHGYHPMPQQAPMMGAPMSQQGPPSSHPSAWDRYHGVEGRQPRP
jgi:hypothetical protein